MHRLTLTVVSAVLLLLLGGSPFNNVALSFSLPPAIESTLHQIPNTIAYPAAFLGTFRVGAALSVIGYPRMPSIDTEVMIGSTILRLPSSSGGARVRLFYPTNATTTPSTMTMDSSFLSSSLYAPYCTDGKQTSDGMAALVGFRQLGLSFLLRHLSSASSGCLVDVLPIVNNETTSLPLLIYSHGYGGNMDMATYFFRTMASKGMIVAAVEHTDGTASSTVLDDEYERRFNEYFMTGRQQLVRRASELLEAERFLPMEIARRYGVTIDTIMLGGHSYGAPSAIMASNGASTSDSNIRGLILHDPALGMGYGMLPPNGAKCRVPAVSYVSDEYNKANVRYGDITIHVRGCRHGNFVDAPLWAPRWIMSVLSLVIPVAGPSDAITVHNQLADSAIAFLKSQNPMSEGVSSGELLNVVNVAPSSTAQPPPLFLRARLEGKRQY
jgi:pimeloyl-ACP methyl ester carboxylesterase